MSGMDSKVVGIWRKGYGPIVHREETVERMRALASSGRINPQPLYRMLAAADRLVSAAMWTVAHMAHAAHLADAAGTLAAWKRDEILFATEHGTLDGHDDAAGLAAVTF